MYASVFYDKVLQTAEHLKDTAFACAVGPQEQVYLAKGDFKIDQTTKVMDIKAFEHGLLLSRKIWHPCSEFSSQGCCAHSAGFFYFFAGASKAFSLGEARTFLFYIIFFRADYTPRREGIQLPQYTPRRECGKPSGSVFEKPPEVSEYIRGFGGLSTLLLPGGFSTPPEGPGNN